MVEDARSEGVAVYHKLPIDSLKRRSYAQSPPTSPTAKSPVSLPLSPGSSVLLRQEEHGLQGSRAGWPPGYGPCSSLSESGPLTLWNSERNGLFLHMLSTIRSCLSHLRPLL